MKAAGGRSADKIDAAIGDCSHDQAKNKDEQAPLHEFTGAEPGKGRGGERNADQVHLSRASFHVVREPSQKSRPVGGFRGWIMVDEWEVPDPYDACIKCKRAIDQASRA